MKTILALTVLVLSLSTAQAQTTPEDDPYPGLSITADLGSVGGIDRLITINGSIYGWNSHASCSNKGFMMEYVHRLATEKMKEVCHPQIGEVVSPVTVVDSCRSMGPNNVEVIVTGLAKVRCYPQTSVFENI